MPLTMGARTSPCKTDSKQAWTFYYAGSTLQNVGSTVSQLSATWIFPGLGGAVLFFLQNAHVEWKLHGVSELGKNRQHKVCSYFTLAPQWIKNLGYNDTGHNDQHSPLFSDCRAKQVENFRKENKN